jgi:hypothetical protein
MHFGELDIGLSVKRNSLWMLEIVEQQATTNSAIAIRRSSLRRLPVASLTVARFEADFDRRVRRKNHVLPSCNEGRIDAESLARD